MQTNLSSQQIRSRIRPRLLSSEYHADRLEGLVKKHIAADVWLTWYADMAGLLPDDQVPQGATAVAPVTVGFADQFGLSLTDLLHLGYDNTHGSYTARPLGDVLGMLCDASLPAEEDDSPVPLYVLTNADARYGAAAVLDPDIQHQLHDLFGSKFFLLPTSVHDFLCVPATGDDQQAHDLAHMVHTINHDPNIMNPSDILSDHVYCIENDTLAVVV